MLNIFIPQKILEDIIINNMASDTKPEDQNIWFNIFTNQKVIYVSSKEEEKEEEDISQEYQEDNTLQILSNSYGVQVKDASQYIKDIPKNHQLVTQYRNGIFLLDISPEDAAKIQQDYGVICQSVQNMDTTVLIDEGLKYSPEEDDKKYTWYYMLGRISPEHIPSNHLIMIDRYLFANSSKLESTLDNIFYILDAMLPHNELKRPYKVTIFYGEQKEGNGIGISQAAKEVYNIIPDLKRPYTINVEVIYLTHICDLYKPFHNRRILTNYTITQLEYRLNALEDEKSTCQQTVTPQRLFSPSGLAGYCDSPHKMHHDIMSYINDYFIWWVPNYLSSKSTYSFNGQVKLINKFYGVDKTGENDSLFEKRS